MQTLVAPEVPEAVRARESLDLLLSLGTTPRSNKGPDAGVASARARHLGAAVRQLRELVSRPEVRRRTIAVDVLDLALQLEEQVRLDPRIEDRDWAIHETVTRLQAAISALWVDVKGDGLQDPATAARYVLDRLAGLPQRDVALLLGVDPRTVREWNRGIPAHLRKNEERVVELAQILRLLDGLSPRGVMRWFTLKRRQLGGRTPLHLLDARSSSPALRELAQQVSA